MSLDASFVTQTWELSGVLLTDLANNGAPANLWFDVDISVQTPTLGLFRARAGDPLLTVGRAGPTSTNTWELQPISSVHNFDARSDGRSENLEVQGNVVNMMPTPATLALFGLSLTGLVMVRRKRKPSG